MSTWFPLHASATTASLTLTVFWAMVTAGRVLFAVVQRWVPSRLAYHVLPVVLAGSFVFIAELPPGSAGAGVLAFGLAGLGCSALLPLTISFGQERLTTISAAVAGGVIASYQFGYGLAAFGGRPAPFRRGHAARDLWRNRCRSRRARGPVVGGRRRPSVTGGAASQARHSPEVTVICRRV